MYTDKHVFAQMLYDNKKMNTIEYQIYLKWFDEFLETIVIILRPYIFAPAQRFVENRVLQRARLGENIPLEYLKECHHYHDRWLNDPW